MTACLSAATLPIVLCQRDDQIPACIHQIRIFDYTEKFAEPLRDLIRQNAQLVAQENEIESDSSRAKPIFAKEARIQSNHRTTWRIGLVHIFSAMEGCAAYPA